MQFKASNLDDGAQDIHDTRKIFVANSLIISIWRCHIKGLTRASKHGECCRSISEYGWWNMPGHQLLSHDAMVFRMVHWTTHTLHLKCIYIYIYIYIFFFHICCIVIGCVRSEIIYIYIYIYIVCKHCISALSIWCSTQLMITTVNKLCIVSHLFHIRQGVQWLSSLVHTDTSICS